MLDALGAELIASVPVAIHAPLLNAPLDDGERVSAPSAPDEFRMLRHGLFRLFAGRPGAS
jgi:hypothetical protein